MYLKKTILNFCTLFTFFFIHIGAIDNKKVLEGPFLPENTQLQFDIDETIVEKNRFQLWIDLIKDLHYRVDLLFPLLFTNADPNYINCAIGHPWNLYYQAINRPALRPYVDQFMKRVASSHHLIPGVIDILMRLKQKGYSIVYATNKDRISYAYTINALKEPFSSLPDAVLVYFRKKTDPIMNAIKHFIDTAGEQEKEFADMMRNVYDQTDTELITHAYKMKPSQEYVSKQREIAGDKKIIFFDDLAKNVEAMSFDQNSIGIQVFASAESILNPLFQLGIFSHDDPTDKALYIRLSEYYNSGILTKVGKWWHTFKRWLWKPVSVRMPAH